MEALLPPSASVNVSISNCVTNCQHARLLSGLAEVLLAQQCQS